MSEKREKAQKVIFRVLPLVYFFTSHSCSRARGIGYLYLYIDGTDGHGLSLLFYRIGKHFLLFSVYAVEVFLFTSVHECICSRHIHSSCVGLFTVSSVEVYCFLSASPTTGLIDMIYIVSLIYHIYLTISSHITISPLSPLLSLFSPFNFCCFSHNVELIKNQYGNKSYM